MYLYKSAAHFDLLLRCHRCALGRALQYYSELNAWKRNEYAHAQYVIHQT